MPVEDINTKDDNGGTPLDITIARGRFSQSIEILKDSGAGNGHLATALIIW